MVFCLTTLFDSELTRRQSSSRSIAIEGSAFNSLLCRWASSRCQDCKTIGSSDAPISSQRASTIRYLLTRHALPTNGVGHEERGRQWVNIPATIFVTFLAILDSGCSKSSDESKHSKESKRERESRSLGSGPVYCFRKAMR
jgi:hypothetical protein